MTPSLGNAPYCYANSLAMTLGAEVAPATIEVLTGSPFGYQRVGPMALFDPVGWDPDLGLDQALAIMGVRHERRTHPDARSALASLRELTADGPVFVGPLEMGLLRHQPDAAGPIGADHFVAVVAVDDDRIVMHDPQGYPYASLPTVDFLMAWGAETLPYGVGRFALRTGFTAPVGAADDWLRALVPQALRWARGDGAVTDPAARAGNAAGLRELGFEVLAGAFEEPGPTILATFALRLGARRRVDAARAFAASDGLADLAELLDRQADVLGGGQYDAVRRDGRALAARFEEAADLHDGILEALRAAT